MSILESIILGIIEELRFLPISSSGHIEIGKVFNIDLNDEKVYF